ncbi:DnaJ protein, putative [Plasmodium ovale wallikeri]|uniref:DnaJ protein, putative n=1 Tax=Plasmodium ovale wallikeri TaxID=864142 RepID=A0A1A8YR87_PLAOA|nr:DnaJ protein, putative [Plasmodium ovale wallikeri]SBT34445.1 DnaJ protein, putative [Plasmodium ovale wallikeri]
MNCGNFFLSRCIFAVCSKLAKVFCGKGKIKVQGEIINCGKNSKIVNFPLDRNSLNFYFISNVIKDLLDLRGRLPIKEGEKRKLLLQRSLNLYYLLLACIRGKRGTFLAKRSLAYIEERIVQGISNKAGGVNKGDSANNANGRYGEFVRSDYSERSDNAEERMLPYNIRVLKDPSLGIYPSSIGSTHNIVPFLPPAHPHLIVDKDEISADEEWKRKHESLFKRNKLKIPISKHNYEFVLSGLQNPLLREEVIRLLNIPYRDKNLNTDVINILKKRYDFATRMGYRSWAEYSITQFTSEKHNYKMIPHFTNLIREKIKIDYDVIHGNMMRMANSEIKNRTRGKYNLCEEEKKKLTITSKLPIQDWIYYYGKILNKSGEYSVNLFFPQEHVLNRFIEVISKIYNFSYEEVLKGEEGIREWPKETRVYRIEQRGSGVGVCMNHEEKDRLLGYIYLVPYMDIKFRDYFRIPCTDSLSSTCLLSAGHAAIECKYIKTIPIQNKLFSMSEVLTLFHEFGHAYHLLLLSRKHSLYELYNLPLDYAEFFSHINEHLANNFNVILHLTKQAENNRTINENIFKRLQFDITRIANIYSQSMIDYTIHDLNPYTFFKNVSQNENRDENDLKNFYNIIQNHFLYTFPTSYSIHSGSFPYHFSCNYAGSVISYLLAEMRVLMNIPTEHISLKRYNTLSSFQKTFYKIVSEDFTSDVYSSVIRQVLGRAEGKRERKKEREGERKKEREGERKREREKENLFSKLK